MNRKQMVIFFPDAAVLLGPLRAITYVLMHGGLAAALGSMWVWQWPWAASILAGAGLRMAGQLGYLVLSSLTMNENLFAVMLANVHNLLVRGRLLVAVQVAGLLAGPGVTGSHYIGGSGAANGSVPI